MTLIDGNTIMKNYNAISYEIIDQQIARIMLNRPDKANAQDTEMLYELDHAMEKASQDDAIRVIILGAHGPHFSAGHDLSERNIYEKMSNHQTVGTFCCFTAPGIEGHMAREEEIYLGFCEKWRNISKPTIAAVQGKCIAGGLMLVWPCDIILASDNASFCDPTLSFGVPGVEYFMMPWEVGARKAKELLFTADALSATEALTLGMINQVTSETELHNTTLELARRIAKKSPFALKLAKQAVNAAQDVQGRSTNLQQAFTGHQLAHAHNLKQFDLLLDPSALPEKTREALFKQEDN